MVTAKFIKEELLSLSDPEKKEFLPYFFKTGPGQYGEGDRFIGVVVPQQRLLVKLHKVMELSELELLLNDEYHECRLTALLFLVNMFNKSKEENERKRFYDFYISHVDRINNWDLVDLSARDIVGGYLWDKSREDLYRFAQQDYLWLQRISIVATYYFIKRDDFIDTFNISTMLMNHKHDLIHKAVGWMLREAGKMSPEALDQYLKEDDRYTSMPRTMLRYAIEKYPEYERKAFLQSKKGK